MGDAGDSRSEFAERIKKVEGFVREYQSALRALHGQLPSDDQAAPRQVAASLGRCDIWPCRDAAVVLTYADDSAGLAVAVRNTVDKSVSEFMKEGEVFTYYDDSGRATAVRLSFAPLEQDDPRYDPRIPPDDFSLRVINLSDVVGWAEDKKTPKAAPVRKFLRPEFKKVSVYGWNAHLGDPNREALKDFRKAFVLANILGQDGEELIEREKMQKAVGAADLRIAEFESLLDQSVTKERAEEFLKLHSEILHPAQLRRYTDVPIGEDRIADFLLLVQEDEGLEYVFVKLGPVDDSFFTDSGQHSEAFLRGEEEISAWEKCFTENSTRTAPHIPEGSTVRFHLIIGRNSTLGYLQRKELRSAAAKAGRSYCTYDDLASRFRYVVNDVTNVWDRFEPVDARLRRIGINTEEDFSRLMEIIDQEMRDEETPIRARSFQAVGKFTLGYSTSLMHRDPLTNKIHEWFDRRYGDRLKIDPTWKMAVVIRGDLYRLRLPLVYGAANVICSPEHYGLTSQAVAGRGGRLPTINVLDLIDDFTEEYAKSLTKDELEALFYQFHLGFAAMNEVDSISKTELVTEAVGDIDASVSHLFANQPQFGLSKWSSLQATEKLIKAFISQKGEKYKATHKLEELASKAETLGLNAIPRDLLDKVQCTPGVRYGDPAVSLTEAVTAHHIALDICSGVASQIFLARNFQQAKELEAGKYYINSLRKAYRCIEVNGDKATIMLFDEVMGKTLEAQFVQDRKYWGQYYILTDPATISRLERRYQTLLAKDAAGRKTQAAKGSVKVGRNDPCPCGSGKKYKKCCGN